jgi:uncharacterized protein
MGLFGLGVCFGAGPMVRAVAADSRFRAFAGVAGVYTDNAKTKAALGAAYQATIDRGRAAEGRWRETGEAETIPAVAPDGGDVAMPLREAYEFYGTPRGRVTNYVNAYAVQSSAYTTPFDARGAADAIRAPGADRPLGGGAGSRPRSRLLLGRQIAQAGAMASLAGPDRLLRRPESHRPGS